jgi:aerobic carbon-monoxide dehydrogenase large subunit
MGEYAIGQPMVRVEDPRLLTGRGQYGADIDLPGQAHGVVVRSPHAHARFRRIDASAALAMPGVIAVLSHAELAADGIGNMPGETARTRFDGSKCFPTPRPVLLQDRVRMVGDPVAFVIAESRAQAQDAAERVAVDWQELPAVAHANDAAAAGAPLVWDEVAGNLAWQWQAGNKAAADEGFTKAAHVAKLDFTVSRVSALPMEPRNAVATYDEMESRYTLYTGMQGPWAIRQQLAGAIFKVPMSSIRVVTKDVGGSFGMRSGLYPELILVMWAAKRLGRPVKWVSERQEGFVSDEHARDHVTTVELALDKDARFLAMRVRNRVNIGAYLTQRTASYTNNAGGLAGMYITPAIHVTLDAIHTNTIPTSPYRGAGRPEASYAIERVIDVAAAELGIDRVELRRRNLIPPSAMPFKTGLVFTYDSGNFAAIMDTAMRVGDWAGFAARRAESAKRGKRRGIGLANCIEVAGGPYTGPGLDMADVRVAPDGSVMAITGTTSFGQGNETMMTQLVSATLGVDSTRIKVGLGDTDMLAMGRGNGGSSASSVGTAAMVVTLQKVIDKGKQIAATLLEAAPVDVEFKRGRFSVMGTDRAVSFAEVARAAYTPAKMKGMEPGLQATGSFQPGGVNFPNGCHVCEVEVDPETGNVDVLRYSIGEDVGVVINPLTLAGQIHGGVVQGLGQALGERMAYDGKSAQLLSGSFMDYGMPRADDVPAITVEPNPIPTKTNPLGAKGAGEAGTVGALPAVISAVCDALGVKHIDMPATPERVWRALRQR